MKRKSLFKSLLVAAGLLVGGSAWAQTETVNVLSEDYESYTAGDITATMQSKGWNFQSKNSKNQITIVQGASDAANPTKYFDFYYPDGGASRNQSWNMNVSSSLDGSDNWTLTFSAALNPGTGNSANVFSIVGTKSGNVTTANNEVTNPFIKLKGTASAAVTYVPTIGSTDYDQITLTSGAWYDFTIKATNIDATANTATLFFKIASGSTTVIEETIDNFSTANIGTLYGICWNSPRSYSRLSLDNVLVTKEVDASVCADPTYSITGANGTNRTFTLACETSGSTIYYATTNLEKGAAGWTEYASQVSTDATTIYAYAAKGSTTSNIISFATGAGTEISLNAPILAATNMVANGDVFNAVFDASYNASGVEFEPAATLSATFTPKGGTAVAVTLPYTATENGTLTVVATADGFTSTNSSIIVYASYVKEWQSANFSTLAADDVASTLGSNWVLQEGSGRWASWKDQSYTYYAVGGASNITANERLRMRGVITLNLGYGLGRNITGSEPINVLSTTEGDIVAFHMYNGHGNYEVANASFNTYFLNSGTTPYVNTNSGDLLVQATVYAPIKYESMSIVGDFSANAWDATNGIAMTRDANNVHLWKAELKNFVADSKTYEYKATANQNWDDYVLPSGDNATFAFGTTEYPAGTYNLTFTVNTKDHSLVLSVEPVYTVAGCYKIGATETASFFGTSWAPTETANNMTLNADGIYELKFTDVVLGDPGIIIYKVTANNSWTTSYPDQNATWEVKEPGIYDFTFTFNPTSKEVGCNVAITKEISDAGYATYCSNYGLDFKAAGLNAYIAKLDVTNVDFKGIDDAPANNGVLLEGAKGTYKIPVIVSSTSMDGNALIGVLADTKVPAGSFVLMNTNNKVGFYKTLNEFTVGAHTAYLPALSTARDFIWFGEETTTSIEGIAPVLNDNKVYNLNGQRVVAPQKGLYIVNGKKVVLK